MVKTLGLEFAAKTDPGLVRSQNEDAIAISPAFGFAILADGMGGYNAGEVASSMATTVLKKLLEEGLTSLEGQVFELLPGRNRQIQNLMVESIQRVNAAILEAAIFQPQYSGMGTTLIAALFHQDRLIVAHVGDSRAYRLRQGELTQITRDHSLLQEQIDAGLIDPEWARFSQNRNLITRAIGTDTEVNVEIHDHHVEPGDIYLLCSDGLNDMLAAEEIRDTITGTGPSLESGCEVLIESANRSGGYDNISVVLIKVRSLDVPTEGVLDRILRWVK